MNSKIIIAIIAILAIGGIIAWSGGKDGANSSGTEQKAERSAPSAQSKSEGASGESRGANENTNENIGGGSPEAASEETVKEFVVTGTNFSFSPSEIRVKKGDKVRIVFRNAGGVHNWRIDEFSAATSVIREGGETTVEFIADKAGEFEYYCEVGNHRALGMVGRLIVE